MKKKFLNIVLTACMVVCVSFGLVACGTTHTHTLWHTEAVSATCETAGNVEYWYCAGCEKYFSDEDGKNEITQEQTIVSALGHNWDVTSYSWASDNSTCLATHTCLTDASHVESETANATYIVEQDSMKIVYTATFANSSFETQTTEKLINKSTVALVGDVEYQTLQSAFASDITGETAIVLVRNVTEDIIVAEGQNRTLNLNGFQLTNASGNTITNNGTLVVRDSSENGNGTVVNTKANTAVLVNNGTAILESGKYIKTLSSYYVIDNYGNLRIGTSSLSNVRVLTTVSGSSLIKNGWNSPSDRASGNETIATCVVEGGTFSGGLNNIKNDNYSSLTINYGLFMVGGPDAGYSNIMNYGNATINGGVFYNTGSVTSDYKTANVLNLYNGDLSTPASMAINGGNFESSTTYSIYNSVSNLVITNGSFYAVSCAIIAPTPSSDISLSEGEVVAVNVSGGVFVGYGGAGIHVQSGYQCSITGGSFTGTSYGVNIATKTEATISNATVTATATTGVGINVTTTNTNLTISNTVVDAPQAIKINNGRDIQVAITSGVFNGSINLSGSNTLAISGGSFSVSPESYLAEGLEAVQNQETGMYEVRESENVEEEETPEVNEDDDLEEVE